MQRPRWRLTVRWMMVLVLLTAVGLGWVVYRARVVRKAVVAIEQGGGKAYFDWEVTVVNGPFAPFLKVKAGAQPNAPGWLVRAIGPEYFGDVLSVGLGPGDADRVMTHVGRLGHLEQLSIDRQANITGAGAGEIAGLRRLKVLIISGTSRVGGDFVAGLTNAGRLRRLVVQGIPLSDADVAPLRRLTSLTDLELTDTDVTDAGLPALASLVRLRNLNLSGSKITSRGLVHLRGYTNLRRLILGRTRVDEVGPISHLTSLDMLMLGACPIDDAGLKGVRNLAKLRKLILTGTRVSDAGLAMLRRDLPRATIAR